MSDIGLNRLNPIPAKNSLGAPIFDNVQSFYIQKMSDFGFQGFNLNNQLSGSSEFTSKSETALMTEKSKKNRKNLSKSQKHLKIVDDQFMFQKRMVTNRLSALNRSTAQKQQCKTDIELIPNFEDKIKYLNKEAKQLDKLQQFIDVQSNLPKRNNNTIKPLHKTSVSARYYSSSLIICKCMLNKRHFH